MHFQIQTAEKHPVFWAKIGAIGKFYQQCSKLRVVPHESKNIVKLGSGNAFCGFQVHMASSEHQSIQLRIFL